MFKAISQELSPDSVMQHLMVKVHEFDNQPLYNLEFKMFLLLDDRMAISELLKTRPISPDFYNDAKKIFQTTIKFYDENLYTFCKDFIEVYEKLQKHKKT